MSDGKVGVGGFGYLPYASGGGYYPSDPANVAGQASLLEYKSGAPESKRGVQRGVHGHGSGGVDSHGNDLSTDSSCFGRTWTSIRESTTANRCMFLLYIIAMIIVITVLVNTPESSLPLAGKIVTGIGAALVPLLLVVIADKVLGVNCCKSKGPGSGGYPHAAAAAARA